VPGLVFGAGEAVMTSMGGEGLSSEAGFLVSGGGCGEHVEGG
jgi:hypothetical protein